MTPAGAADPFVDWHGCIARCHKRGDSVPRRVPFSRDGRTWRGPQLGRASGDLVLEPTASKPTLAIRPLMPEVLEAIV
jgi:hypothetical protein